MMSAELLFTRIRESISNADSTTTLAVTASALFVGYIAIKAYKSPPYVEPPTPPSPPVPPPVASITTSISTMASGGGSVMSPPRSDLAPPKDDPFTLEELKVYDGKTEGKPIYVAIKGMCPGGGIYAQATCTFPPSSVADQHLHYYF